MLARVGRARARLIHTQGETSEWTATVRGGGAVSGRTENGGIVLSPVTRKSTKRARTGGDVLTKERLKEKEPERRGDGGGSGGGRSDEGGR